MTVYLDATALTALHTETAARRVVLDALAGDPQWATSAITLAEALALADRLAAGADRADLEDLIRLTWDRLAVVPVDSECIARATSLLRDQPLRLSDALHLAAADRLPPPVQVVTFDPAQIPVALALGMQVLST